MDPQSPVSLIEKFNHWLRESVTIKLASIGFLVILLLIPSSWISQLIEERQQRANGVIEEVAQLWSGSQTVSGPILVIPYKRRERVDLGDKKFEVREWEETAYFLPDDLRTDGAIAPEVLHRGIFDAVVYKANLQVTAKFLEPDFKSLNIAPEDVVWSGARLATGITDLRGISDDPKVTVGGVALPGEPSNSLGVKLVSHTPVVAAYDNQEPDHSSTGMITRLGWTAAADFKGDVVINLPLKGSSQLYFSPLGKHTEVKLNSPWPNPSFDGGFIPVERTVLDSGFQATWRVLHYNRPFSQQWTADNVALGGYDFGVKLLVPVDQYQKSIRTSKYGILVVLLTFLALFLVEIMKSIRIHPFQYILVGAALIIYYSLLLSLSEHFGYNWSYLASTVATVGLITLYAGTFLASRSISLLFSFVLLFFYGFIFVLIQLQDYSLLLGSIGLFGIVAALMYLSRKVNWYKN